MDKKIYKGTTFSRNLKNFKENIWKAKKAGYQFSIFRKSFKWRVEGQNSKTGDFLNMSEIGFDELEHAFDFIVGYNGK